MRHSATGPRLGMPTESGSDVNSWRVDVDQLFRHEARYKGDVRISVTSLLCGVLPGACATLELLEDLERAKYPLHATLHLSLGTSPDDERTFDKAGLRVLGTREDLAVRGVAAADLDIDAARRLAPLDLLDLHSPEVYWSLVDGHVRSGKHLMLMVLDDVELRQREAIRLFLARSVERVQVIDVGMESESS